MQVKQVKRVFTVQCHRLEGKGWRQRRAKCHAERRHLDEAIAALGDVAARLPLRSDQIDHIHTRSGETLPKQGYMALDAAMLLFVPEPAELQNSQNSQIFLM